jgi:hypothetical protein
MMERSAAAARSKKYAKSEVDYERPAQGMDHCSECVHFEVYLWKNKCEIVAGEILPGDWCSKFKRKE